MEDLFERAKALHNEGRLDEAEAAYLEHIRSDPEDFKAHNNLGTVYEEKLDFATAVASYRRALEINSDASPVHYNLGHALQRQGQFEAAIDAYEASLASGTDNGDTYYNIGHARHDLGDLEAAESAYRRAIESDPKHYRACSSLGNVLFDQSRMTEAEELFRQALEIEPDSAADHFNVGRVCEVQGKLQDAIDAFRESLGLNPLSPITYEHLVGLENKLNGPNSAAKVFDQWLAFMPGNPVALHLQAALNGDQTVSRASDEYVRTVFDGFAPEFDRTLERLSYSAPEEIGHCLRDLLGDPDNSLDVLDAGCGTGLCGPYVRPYADRLTGVDLSGAMLDKARERGGYDELVEAEITSFLLHNEGCYDLIVSTDVLVYFGDLVPVFAAAAMALRRGGHLVFTVEYLDASQSSLSYLLNPHGRYSHTEAYLQQALGKAGLVARSSAIANLRKERDQPVKELVVVARAPAADS
jgi:predicted TPR repeat methyltransferase